MLSFATLFLSKMMTSHRLTREPKSWHWLSMQYVLKDDAPYWSKATKLRVFPPVCSRQQPVELHGGTFGGHLREVKVLSQPSRHFWWPTIRKDIINRSRPAWHALFIEWFQSYTLLKIFVYFTIETLNKICITQWQSFLGGTKILCSHQRPFWRFAEGG